MRPQGKHEMSDSTSATRPAGTSTPGSSTPHAPVGADAAIAADAGIAAAIEAPPSLRWRWLRKHPTLILGIVLLLLQACPNGHFPLLIVM